MSDEIVILRDGKIEQQGVPGTLYEKPATRFVADFLGKSNFLQGAVSETGDGAFTYVCGGQPLVQGGAAAHTKLGGEVVVALRPEKIALSPERPASTNAVSGRISAFNYYGSAYHFQVTTETLGELIATAPAWTCAVEPSIGNEIWLGWEPDASVVVRDR